ncbi:MAG: hypothetical protein HOP16_14005 [Acidobacteria bacterium]|nr:hypothetical protein [Acidobacteriota bacterium]
MTKRVVMFGIGMLMGSAPVWAHHAFSAEFDVNKPMKLQGTLAKWEMINPHSWFHIDVKDPDGKVVRWMIEGGSPNQLIRLGVTKNTLAVGTELLVDGYLARAGGNKGVARNFTLLDGRRLFLGGSAPPDAAGAEVK